ncbi:hypothetical protein HYC85_005472 [Camellia sinensis]|uniref:Uncharacterized protein n=1 Tax=Camellia sinensis TaxID=4442 RepID=A0A7J7I0T6_CAMSI|nr:hypothetical protein HYC85_005472 [Camellia sinensis]
MERERERETTVGRKSRPPNEMERERKRDDSERERERDDSRVSGVGVKDVVGHRSQGRRSEREELRESSFE